ncbi:MAG: membrane protein insertase YidC [Deltaproteobacteria bacterium]|nr:MAG: membrane protein insertase YidC [Deltaproteobacteria bacterium]
MEKNVVIAFVLSILVLLAWSLLFAPKAPKEEVTQVEKERAAPETVETPMAKAPPPSKEVEVLPTVKDKEIRVETPLYRAVFTNAGPTVKSFKLKKYRKTPDANSELIELVHLGKSGEDFLRIDFNHGATPETRKTLYHVEAESLYLQPDSAPQDLNFKAVRSDGVSVNQTFRFYPDKYQIDLLVNLQNQAENQIQGNLRAHVKNIPSKDRGRLSFVGVALLLNGKLKELEPDDKEIKEERDLSGQIGWVAYEDEYFMGAIVPDVQEEGSFKGGLLPSGVLKAIYMTPPISLASQEQVSSRFTLYLGPRELSVLKQLDKQLDLALNFGFFDIIARPMLSALRFFNKYVKNYGISIIIITILIKILFWPLTHKSYKSMKEMQKLKPLMDKIREKYKHDKQQMNKEVMALYRTYKVNPMGGCLPMVIQIPVFIALYNLFGKSIELRHAPFMLWINDLSAPDRLFSFPFEIPFMSPPYGIPVLTLLMGATMFITQKMTPMPGDPTQAKVMMFLPLFFTFLFINFPSGLVLYWLVNNILQIGQQYRIKRSSA